MNFDFVYLCNPNQRKPMARKKANYPLIEGLEITTLAAEGKAMGRWNDVVVFVADDRSGRRGGRADPRQAAPLHGGLRRELRETLAAARGAFCEHFRAVRGGASGRTFPTRSSCGSRRLRCAIN